MYLLQKYFAEYCRSNEKFQPTYFSVVKNELDLLVNAFFKRGRSLTIDNNVKKGGLPVGNFKMIYVEYLEIMLSNLSYHII